MRIRTFHINISVPRKVNAFTNLCNIKIYFKNIFQKSQSKLYKKMSRRYCTDGLLKTQDNQFCIKPRHPQRDQDRHCYMLAEERRTWNLFRVIRKDPSSRFSLSRRFSKATYQENVNESPLFLYISDSTLRNILGIY